MRTVSWTFSPADNCFGVGNLWVLLVELLERYITGMIDQKTQNAHFYQTFIKEITLKCPGYY